MLLIADGKVCFAGEPRLLMYSLCICYNGATEVDKSLTNFKASFDSHPDNSSKPDCCKFAGPKAAGVQPAHTV